MDKKPNLLFNGSVWCNLDVALRNIDHLFRQASGPLGLTPLEWYILRALYERDGQHASELSQAVGRAATSFTPNLDKLENKGLIERRPDPSDRRAVGIYLTTEGQARRDLVLANATKFDKKIQELFDVADFQAFQRVLAALQSASLD